MQHRTCGPCTALAVFTINAITVTRYDFNRNREVNIKMFEVRRRCEVGAAMATVVVAVLNSLGTGVFFSRQLLILCDSKGPLSSRATMKHCALISPPPPSLILSQQSCAWDRLVRWRCEKRLAWVPRESNGRQTHSQAYLHGADSAEWKLSGNYWLVVDLLAQGSKGKKRDSNLRVNRWFIALPD